MKINLEKRKNLSKIDLVIVCGGRGSRLDKITRITPKPLLKFNKIPFLDYLLNYYKKFNIRKIFLMCGYKSAQFIKKYHNKKLNLIDCECVVEKFPLGTGGCLYLLKKKIKNDFILINGDSFFDFNFNGTLKIFEKQKKNLMLLINNDNYKSNSKLANLDIDTNKKVIFKNNSNFMNGGVYFLKKNFLNEINKKKFLSLEDDILKMKIYNKQILGIKINNKNFIDIGTKKNFQRTPKILKKIFYKPALFLDRDGVINKDNGYVYKQSEFIWNKKIFSFIKNYQMKGYNIFIVTNQSGIGRGYYNEKDFFKLHIYIKNFFINKKIFINDIRYCPHHPTEAKGMYKIRCKCRKPNNGMIENLKKNWMVDVKKSIMFGDNMSDQKAAKKSYIKFKYF